MKKASFTLASAYAAVSLFTSHTFLSGSAILLQTVCAVVW
jgi:hypothetical protein